MRSAMVIALLSATTGCSEGVSKTPTSEDPADASEIPQAELSIGEVKVLSGAEPVRMEDADTLPAHIARRRVKRWDWKSRSGERAALWNIPVEQSQRATILGLFHVCIFEANWNNDRDCIGIWQVLNNIRSPSCNRDRVPTITECDENGETLLSAMRRAQKMAMGMVPPKTRRHRWIRDLTLDCEEPEAFPEDHDWERNYRRWCEDMAELARGLVTGKDDRRVTGEAEPVTWGGRCEVETGACDDPMACRRGLARIKGIETQNAFWCRPGKTGCSDWVERGGIYYSDEICADIAVPPKRPPRFAQAETDA